MIMIRLRQALTLCLLALCAIAARPLTAQTTSLPTPPQVASIDERGVDLLNMEFSPSDSFLSIGVAGHGGLTHSRVWFNNPGGGNYGFLHNYIISLYIDGGTPKFNIGGRTIEFPNHVDHMDGRGCLSSRDYTTGKNDGLSATGYNNGSECFGFQTYKLTEQDGTTIDFSSPIYPTWFSFYLSAHFMANKITHPSGEIETFTYKNTAYQVYNCSGGTTTCGTYTTYNVVRLQSVANNFGYMLHFSHGSNALAYGSVAAANEWMRIAKVQAVNLAQTYCDPAADSCATDNGSVSYSQSYSGTIPGGTFGYQYVNLPDGRSKYYKLNSNYEVVAVSAIGSSSDDTQVSRTWWGTCSGSACNYTHVWIDYNTPGYGRYSYAWTFDSNYVNTAVDVNSYGDSTLYHRWATPAYAPTTGTLCGLGSDSLNGAVSYQSQPQGYYSNNYHYDQYCRVTSAGNPYSYTSFIYDDRGNVTSASVGSSYSSTPIVTTATYPTTCTNPVTCNKPLTITDNSGKVSSFTYDPVHGGVLTATAPAASSGGVQPQTRTSYAQFTAYYKDTTGAIVAAPSAIYLPTGTSTCITTASCMGTADEVKISVSYGATGVANNLLPVSTTTTAGDGSVSSTTSETYDAVGNKISEDGPLAGSADTTIWTYNADRQVTQVVGPDPDGVGPLHNRSVKTTYNVRGQATSVDTGTSNPDGSGYVSLGHVDTIYDGYFRKTSVIAYGSDGTPQARTDVSYDTLGRVDCSALRMNPTLFAPANSTPACTLGTQGNFGPDRITKNIYSVDRVVQQITGYGTSGQRTEFTKAYDYYYGLLTSYTDARGNKTQYAYDLWNRLQKTSYPDKVTVGQVSTTDFEQLTYDANGRLATRQLRDGKQITYTYDFLGRQTLAHMVNPVDANDRDIATSYDLLGRVTQVDDGAGKKVSFTYDALGRTLSESPQLTGGSTSYQYDAAGRRTRLTWSDGFYVTYDYDTLGELLAIRENGASSGVGVLASFAYDDQGKPTGLTRGNGVNSTYTYDAASRLATYTVNHPNAGNSYTFAYSPAGQMVSRSMTNDAYAWTQAVAVNRNYTVNGLNQYTASGAVVPTYDGRGNMTSAGSTAYVYDSKNKLTTFGTNALGYDAMGRLATQATPATRFVYDGSDLIAETDASNNILRRYVHIPGTDNVLVWYEGSGTASRRWLAHDERGSTTLITDASGASLGINAYDEYGIPQSTNLGRFQYTGQTWLPELGMYYYKARIYSPTMGRFMQTDPKGYGDGPNWYNYVHGDPLNGSDPSGTDGMPTQAQIDQMRADSIMMQIRSTEAMMQGGDLMRSLAVAQTESQIADQTMWEAGPQMAEIAAYHAAEANSIIITGTTAGKAGSGSSSSTSTVTLEARTVSGGPNKSSWEIEWVCHGCGKGNIIQNLTLGIAYKNGAIGSFTYSETWTVGKGGIIIPNDQDMFAITSSSVKAIYVFANAAFYSAGSGAPINLYKVGGTPLTGDLPSTWGHPTLPTPTSNTVNRAFSSPW